MQVFVSLYWGGKIVQVPHLGICYDPPRAKGSIILESCVTYYELVGMICDAMRIDMNQHTIEISWRQRVVFPSYMSHICTEINNDASVMFMFNDAQNSTHSIELFVEHSPVRSYEIPPVVEYGVVDYGVGSSMMAEHMSIDCYMNEQTDVADAVDVGVGMNDELDCADVHGDTIRIVRNNEEPLSSSESEGSPSEDSRGDPDDGHSSSDDEIVVCKPVVQGEQPLPQYNPKGLKYFRHLPSGPSGVADHVGDEHSHMYWDEKDPYRIVMGTKFYSKLHVKTAITMWSLWQERQFKVNESKLRRWHAVCKYPAGRTEEGVAIISETDAEQARECKWEVSVTQRMHDDMWEIRKWVPRHSCEGHRVSRDHANFSSSMIALCIRHQLQENPDYKVSAIRTFVMESFHVAISYKKAWYAKRRALEIVFGGWEESFRQLPSYMLELQSQTPGTIVEWKHNELMSQEHKKVFSYVFWAFGPAIHAFQHAQPVLTIDGTHLRGRFKGKLLVACGFDANKTCLPIAYAVVDEETNDSWNWFLGHVRTHVVKFEREVCIISDRHKGILNAFKSDIMKQLPKIHHKFCLIHVRANVLKKYKGSTLKGMIWKLGVTTQLRKYFQRRHDLFVENQAAMQMLNRIKKENWSLCYDDELRWGVTSTNMSECYNNVLRGVRELPIRALIDLTFWRTVKWWNEKKTIMEHTEGRLTPWARDMLAYYDSKGQKHRVRVLDRQKGDYHVRSRPRIYNGVQKGDNGQKVEYKNEIPNCTCGKWQMWRIPCSHACAVARDRGDVMLELISDRYLLSTWITQYSGGSFDAPRHEDYWAKPRWKLCITPSQLLPRRRGRGRTRRIRNQMDVREEDEPRVPRRCRNCGQPGHDRRNCSVGRVM